MNALLCDLPVAIEIEGQEYQINTDFRTGLQCMAVFEDTELAIQEKYGIMLKLIYPVMPNNRIKSIELAIRFLDCGESNLNNKGNVGFGGRLFSFEKDSNYIYAAIKQAYRVDLYKETNLHWWAFCHMFMDLPEECFFSKLISLRHRHKLNKLTKDEKEAYAAIRDIAELPDIMTTEEKIKLDKFMQRLGD